MSPLTTKSDTPFFLSPKFWRTVVILCLVAGFLRGFWDEVQLVWEFFYSIFVYILIRPVPIPFDYATRWALMVMGLNAAIFIIGYLGVLAWIAQFTLPVRGFPNRWLVFWRLFLYDLPFVRLHGPAVFVKGGKPVATEEELESTKPGVALVDQYSAIVLEHEKGAKVRASGSGISFTRSGEKMIGFVDLRKQSRSRKDVSCSTGDGIEVSTTVSTTFTLGEDPDILKVTKIKDSWRVLELKIDDQGYKTIKRLSEELDKADQKEIDQFHSQNTIVWSVGSSEVQKAVDENLVPFVFDTERVIDAVYSRARSVKEGRIGEWTELPVDIAVEEFRNKLAYKLYDELYLPEEPEEYPMKSFKTDFANSIRYMGILGYQIVWRKDGAPLEKGKKFEERDLFFSPPQTFKRFTGLRERGIKILSASFGSLTPASDVIQQRLFDNWRARWQQAADKTTAEYELEAMRIRNRERAKAQQDMIYSLSQILQTEQYASEALAMRLYQALEMAATQPATQRLLPGDTVQMLQNLREWLMPKEPKKENPLDNEFLDGLEVK